MATNDGLMEVKFMHPRRSDEVFVAEVGPQCTGQQALQGLLAGDERGPFLDAPSPGRPYELVIPRSSTQITPNMSFAQAKVIDGDVIEVRQAGQGA